MQFARTGYLVAYGLIPDATSKAWFGRRSISAVNAFSDATFAASG
jgi:hypothetical protein